MRSNSKPQRLGTYMVAITSLAAVGCGGHGSLIALTRAGEWAIPAAGMSLDFEDGQSVDQERRIRSRILESPVAEGDADGDGQTDVVFVVATSTGGSGTFIDVVHVEEDESPEDFALVQRGTFRLGDRVRLESMRLEGPELRIQLIEHAPGDPMCCPTQRETRTLMWQRGRWVER